MYPDLFRLGPIVLHSYSVMLLAGFFIATKVMYRASQRDCIDPEQVIKLATWALALGLVSSRVLYIFTQLPFYLASPLDVFKIWNGGLVFYGGLLGVLPFFFYFTKRHHLPTWRIADILVLGLTINHAFGRLGCLAAGCCYGRATAGNWGVRMGSAWVEPALRGKLLHPVQLYEAFSIFLLFCGLLFLFNRRKFPGQVFIVYGIAYPVIRIFLETFRGDDLDRRFVIEGILSTSQFISVLTLALAVFFLIRMKGSYAQNNRRDALPLPSLSSSVPRLPLRR